MTCGALILAAGASTRLGLPKQLIYLAGESLLERSVRVSREAGCAPIVVVLGAFEELIRSQCNLQDVSIVSNPDWAEGMGTTLSRGIQAFDDVDGVIVMTCDMPAVTPDHLRALFGSGMLMGSAYAGRNGVPAYFPKELFPALLKIKGDAGARDLLRPAESVELLGGELDIDTREDLARAQCLLQ
jgi:molybdenum cofactor cytidylyltransferase